MPLQCPTYNLSLACLFFGHFFQFIVSPDGDLHPAVLGPAFGGLVAGNRIGLTVAFGAKTGAVDILVGPAIKYSAVGQFE
jgi:hypothetical protein